MKNNKARILLLDLETAPLEVFAWGLFDQNIGLSQIKEDWSILSYCAKWLDSKEVIYNDTRKEKNPRNDIKIVKELHKLLSEADILIYQNGDRFDLKKMKARFVYHRLKPTHKHKTFDTLKQARKHFGFTSHKLEYMTHHLGLKNKKLKDREFVGMDLWRECLNKNPRAWAEMQKYNKLDVLSLQDLYELIAPYGNSIDYSIYTDGLLPTCNCGSTNLQKRGFNINSTGRYQRYQCSDCGSWMSDKGKDNNLMSQEKKQSLLKKE